jgi:acyl transferase domain-containing protein/acyl carrier protein/predicted alpha/beta-fold hydrolase/protein-L-isoaspartate O-methyltransferase
MSTAERPDYRSLLKDAFLELKDLRVKLEESERHRKEPVAIVGMGCRFPGAPNPDAFWDLLHNGVDAIAEVPPDRWDVDAWYDPDPDAGKMYTRSGGFLPGVDRFDTAFFGISPREATSMDPQHRLLLEVSWEALEHAGVPPESLTGSQTGVFVGLCSNDYSRTFYGAESADPYMATGNAFSVASGRLSYVLGLQGPNVALDTACSSSLVAVHLACQSLRNQDCRMALAGGVNLILSPISTVTLSALRALSPTGRCKTFDADADGFVRSEGCGVVVLKLLSDAIADGDRVLAVIRGSDINHDGRSNGLTAPNGLSQEAVIRKALSNAGARAAEISYVEAHGTGTKLGDPIEMRALGNVLGEGREKTHPFAVGSVKTNIGHLEGAAGVASLIKVVLSLQHHEIPASLHFHQPNPFIDWDHLPAIVPTRALPWDGVEGRRLAGISSFGFSGTNAHLIVEEFAAEPAPATAADRPVHILTLSARTDAALIESRDAFDLHLASTSDHFSDICYTAAAGRSHFEHRIAIVAATAAQAREKLAAAAPVHRETAPRVAFLFSGQGSQYPGMGGVFGDIHLPDAEQTRYVQPALYTLEYRLAQLWRSWGVEPAAVLGHSVGEYAAAAVAGLFTYEEGLRLITRRAELMQQLPAGGAMLAAQCSEAQAAEFLSTTVSLAAVNGPQSIVLSGDADALDRVRVVLEKRAIHCDRLRVSHAFHSSRLDPMLPDLQAAVAQIPFQQTRIPLISNLTGRAATTAELSDPTYWTRHARQPVRFRDGIQTLQAQGCDAFIEIGPHPVLLGMARAQLGDAALALPSLRRGRDDWEQLLNSLAALYTAGASIDWKAFDAPYPRRKVSLPTYAFQRQVFRLDPAPAVVTTQITAASLADHRVFGRVIAPGAWFVCQMLAKAGSALEDVSFAQALVLDDDNPATVQTTSSAEKGVRVLSRTGDSWTLHAAAKPCEPSTLTGASIAPEDFIATAAEVDIAAFYEGLRRRDIEHGPAFRRIAALWRAPGQALGRIQAAPDSQVTPGILDSCFQLMGAALYERLTDSDAWVPVAIERLAFTAPLPAEFWCKAKLRDIDSANYVADLHLEDDGGQSVGVIQGLQLRRVARESLFREKDISGWLTETRWIPQPRMGTGAIPCPSAATLQAEARRLAVEQRLDEHRAGVAELETLSAEYAALALRTVDAAAVVPAHQRLYARLRQMVDAGLPETLAPAARLQQILARYPEFETEVNLLAECGGNLAAILTGAVNPLDILFPGGSPKKVEKLYRDSPFARVTNTIAAEAIRTAIESLPPARGARILELGAGTGGTTASILRALPPGRTDYLFTDISPVLTAKAQEKFAAHKQVRYGTLDIEKPPAAPGQFDVILAANVLHATRNLRETLHHVREYLAPGGLLVLVEGSGRQRWIDLIFGLTDGWWRFDDAELRDHYPLVPPTTWQSVLEAEGFTDTSWVHAGCDPTAPFDQIVLLSRAPAAAPAANCVALADTQGFAAQLPNCVLTTTEDFATLAPPRAIVLLTGLDATENDLPEARRLTVDTALRAIQTAGKTWTQPPRLFLVTRHAQAVLPGDPVEGLAQSPLWGMAKVVALEHPELRCTCIDLDVDTTPAELAAELLCENSENQIAFRRGARYVQRLVPAAASKPLPAGPFHLASSQRGLIDSLTLTATPRRKPGPGEVEIQVAASGLNFMDVLEALGALPFDRGWFGGECSGTITAIGDGVTALQPGDEVIALAQGSFSRYAIADARFTLLKPPAVSMEDAATFPIAFLTVWQTLHQLAHIKAGDRVLIHAAAGGVGLAAVQLALRAGGEVFATAGSTAKRDYLKSLGVAHVMDSRSLDFAAQTLALTGGAGVDIVLNSLAGEFIERSLSVVKPGGVFLEIGDDVIGHLATDPAAVAQAFRDLVAQLGAGDLKPLPHTAFPMQDAAKAFHFMQHARHTGKILLTVAPPPAALAFREDATYLIAGGLGGLGLEVTRWMLDKGARHFALMNRRAPSPEAAAAVDALQQRGAHIHTVAGDVSQAADVARALAHIREHMPPLRGTIHSTGVLDDGVILQQTPERFATVMASKVDGAWNLHSQTLADPLDFFVLFSSAAALLGSPGQANHAAANSFEDMLAHRRRAENRPALAIDWGAWEKIGAAAGRQPTKAVRMAGIGSMQPAEGLQALATVMAGSSAQAGVVPIDWPKFARQFAAGGLPPFLSEFAAQVAGVATATAPAANSRILRALQAAPPRDRLNLLSDFVIEQAAKVLGIAATQSINPRQPLNELGLDSLMAVELRNSFGTALGRSLPPTLLFDYPTLEALTNYFAGEVLQLETAAEAAPAAAPPNTREDSIAIIGLGCRFPGGANNPEAFWDLLNNGVDAVCEIPPTRWDVDAWYDPDPEAGKMYTKSGGFLREVDRYDTAFFGISPREAASMDPQHRMLLEVTWEALEHAGVAPESLSGSQTGVFVGLCSNDYATTFDATGAADPYMATGNTFSVAAGRLSYVLGLQGPNLALDTACSSSLVAVHLACQSLRNQDCGMALAAGVNLILSPKSTVTLSSLRALSPTGLCKTFDADADGFVRGEGCGVVVLKRLSDAVADGDRVLAIIRGSDFNHDGRSNGLTAPNGLSQEAVIRKALASAGVRPAEISYVEAHGTGTKLGDPIEMRALGNVLGEGRDKSRPFAVGSVKTNIGHPEGAAGVAGLIKVVLSLQHRQIPAHLHFHQPSPFIDWDRLPAIVPTRTQPWEAIEGRRLAGISSFGFSGTNAHVIVEEAPAARVLAPAPDRPVHILALSAKTAPALQDLAAAWQRHLTTAAEAFPDLCHTANTGRSHFAHRLAIVAENAAAAAAQLAAPTIAAPREARLKIAFLFTGEDSQYQAMGRELFQTSPVFRGVMERAGACQPGTEAFLYTLQFALAELWRSWGIAPSIVMGQGAGEFAAAAVAGVFTFEEGLRLIAGSDDAHGVNFQSPHLAIVANTGEVAGDRELAAPDYWSRPTRNPAQFERGMQTLRDYGVDGFVEIGPHLDWRQMSETLAHLYTLGAPVDWAAFDAPFPRRRVAAPTYAFQRERHWNGSNAGLQTCYEVRWQPAGPALASALIAPCTIAAAIAAPAAIGHAIAAEIESRGGICAVIAPTPGAILQHIQSENPSRLWILTHNAQPVNGPPADPHQAILWGLGRTIALEHPELWGGLIDADSHTKAADLATAILSGGDENQIAFRRGSRFIPRLVRAEIPAAPLAIRADATYLITGGNGGLGLQLAAWLAQQGARHLVLVSRRAVAPPELGIHVEAIAADISQAEEVDRVLTAIRAGMPPLRGVFHLAGVLDDGVLLHQDAQRFATVLAPKVDGAWNLHNATLSESLDVFALFSSATALLGSPGQANYAAANAFLDSLAHYRHGLGLPAMSLDWGAWQGAGMAAGQSEARWKSLGVKPMSPGRALDAMSRLLASGRPQAAVLDVDWNQLHSAGALLSELVTSAAPAPVIALRDLASIKSWLQAAIQRLLGVQTSVETNVNLVELGFDSLMIMELIANLKRAFPINLYPRELYEYPTIDALSAYLSREIDGSAATTASAPVLVEETVYAPAIVAEKVPNTVFVLSSPRAGSTLLRVMLAGHPDLFCPPELHLLPFDTMGDRGKKLGVSFLGEGLQRALMELNLGDADRTKLLLDRWAAENWPVPEVYRELQRLAAPRLLVDKSPLYAGSLDILRRAESLFENARYIHLVRHPYAVMESFVRNRMAKVLGGAEGDPYALAEQVWDRCNRNTAEFLTEIEPSRCYRILYEDLVREPERIMRSCCEFLDLPFHESLLKPYEGRRMTDGVRSQSLSIGDPNFLQHTEIEPELSDAWKHIELPRQLSPATARLAAQFSYELPREAAPASASSSLAMTEQTVDVRGLPLCVCSWGPPDGPVILLLHGVLDHGAAWEPVALPLARRGFRVIAPDQRGHGRSGHVGAGGSYYLMDFVADAGLLARQFGAKPFTLVGHSMGAAVASLLVSARPANVASLILIECPLPSDAKSGHAQDELATHLEYLTGKPVHGTLPNLAAAASRLRAASPNITDAFALKMAERLTEPNGSGVTWRWDPRLRSRAGIGFDGINTMNRSRFLELMNGVTAPITFIYGQQSSYTNQAQDRLIQTLLPNSRADSVPGAHNVHVDSPELLAEAIARYAVLFQEQKA